MGESQATLAVLAVFGGIFLTGYLFLKWRRKVYRTAINKDMVLFVFLKRDSVSDKGVMELLQKSSGKSMRTYGDLVKKDLHRHVAEGHLKETPVYYANEHGSFQYSRYNITAKGVAYLKNLNVSADPT